VYLLGCDQRNDGAILAASSYPARVLFLQV